VFLYVHESAAGHVVFIKENRINIRDCLGMAIGKQNPNLVTKSI
jgi:hypothetical protein